jgi:regulator of replication initiation timing
MSILSQTEMNIQELLAENAELKAENERLTNQRGRDIKRMMRGDDEHKELNELKELVASRPCMRSRPCDLCVENEKLKEELDRAPEMRYTGDEMEQMVNVMDHIDEHPDYEQAMDDYMEDYIDEVKDVIHKLREEIVELKEMKKWMERQVYHKFGPEWSWSDEKMTYRNSTYEYDTEEEEAEGQSHCAGFQGSG